MSGRALERGEWSLETINIRDFANDRHKSVDDTPAGGGAGMVLKADVLANAIDHVIEREDATRPRLLMSPRGRRLDQKQVRELATGPGVMIVCGRFEGVDQRVIESRKLEEVSIGDYILSGGEVAATVLLDAIIRLLPGVMGNVESGEFESFENELLEHDHYTRPQTFEGMNIPDVLRGGNHAEIENWRHQNSLERTRLHRPDLLDRKSRNE